MAESIYMSRVSFSFNQEGNTLGTTSAEEQIVVECEFQDFDGDPFYVLKTDGFSIDGAQDLQMILSVANEAVKAAQKTIQKNP